MKTKDRKVIDILMITAAIITCIYWIFNSEAVNADPHTLGLIRGFVYTTIISIYARRIL